MSLSQSELSRYSRHILLEKIGKAGQEKLKTARLLCVGAGGLGCPAVLYLAAAGVGQVDAIDPDIVDPSNLQRQILYQDSDVGKKKVFILEKKIKAHNPNITIHTRDTYVTDKNATSLLSGYDVVLDCTDRFSARYAISDACVALNIPNVSASLLEFDGQCSVFCTKEGPCYRCLYKAPPPTELSPSCSAAGVLGVLPGLLAVIQATEAIKLICNIGQPLINRLLLYDALRMQFSELNIEKDSNCPVCGANASTSKKEISNFFEDNIPAITEERLISASELKKIMQYDECFTLDVREHGEYEICNIGAYLIPLSELRLRLNEIPNSKRIVIHCKTGPRSIKAANLLLEVGYDNISVLRGGIMAWIQEVDPSLAKY